MTDISKFTISVPDQDLIDLKERLKLAKFPNELENAEWDMGAPLDEIQRLAKYWQSEFDWKKSEKDLNTLPQFKTTIQCDGFEPLGIHFIHSRSKKDAIPLLYCHGWPGSFLEGRKLLKPLSEGADGQPSFHVVVPSLPNFGFSDGTSKRGFGIVQYAETLHKLMLKLGYNEYVTQGGDWGWSITRAMSLLYPAHCKATHLNMDVGKPLSYLKNPILAFQHDFFAHSEREKNGVKRTKWFREEGFGYNLLQSTKPQTLGYGLADSPVALLAWVYEKLHDWSDDYPWTNDEICTWLSIYWFSTAGAEASLRIYYERNHPSGNGPDASREKLSSWIPGVKIGLSHFPNDISVLHHTWTRLLGDVVFEKEHKRGGHFAAHEKPDELVSDLREMFGKDGGAHGVIRGKY